VAISSREVSRKITKEAGSFSFATFYEFLEHCQTNGICGSLASAVTSSHRAFLIKLVMSENQDGVRFFKEFGPLSVTLSRPYSSISFL